MAVPGKNVDLIDVMMWPLDWAKGKHPAFRVLAIVLYFPWVFVIGIPNVVVVIGSGIADLWRESK